jgi:hypothetical protein
LIVHAGLVVFLEADVVEQAALARHERERHPIPEDE